MAWAALEDGAEFRKCLGALGLGAAEPGEPGALEPPEGATGLRLGAWTWQGKASSLPAWGQIQGSPPLGCDVASALVRAGGCCPIPWAPCPAGTWGRPWQGEGWIPVPSWAGESCVALLKCHLCGCAAVFRQMPGDSGSCSGGWLPPLWVPRPRAATFVGEEASLGETGSCCLWMKGLTSKHLLLAAGFCLLPHMTTQGCVPPKGCTAGSLLCFAPAEFQGKALCKPKGKCGEEGDAGICISHLSRTRV